MNKPCTETFIQSEASGEAVEADVSAAPMEDPSENVANAPPLGLGLPQELGQRFALTTATLKTLRVSNSSHEPRTSWGLSIGKKGRADLMQNRRF